MKNSSKESLAKGLGYLLVGSCLLLVSCSSVPEGNSSNGERWFGMQHCDGCHGDGGLGGKAPKIQKTELSYHEVLRKVRKPKSAIMPSYSAERLSDQSVADIFSYLQKRT